MLLRWSLRRWLLLTTKPARARAGSDVTVNYKTLGFMVKNPIVRAQSDRSGVFNIIDEITALDVGGSTRRDIRQRRVILVD